MKKRLQRFSEEGSPPRIAGAALQNFVPCSVELRCHAAHLLKSAGEITLVGVPQRVADLTDAVGGLTQLPLCSGDQLVVYVFTQRDPDFFPEQFRQGTTGDVAVFGQVFQMILCDPSRKAGLSDPVQLKFQALC